MRSAEQFPRLPAQAAYLAGVAGAGALLSGAVDRAYLAPQELIGVSYLPVYLVLAIALAAATAYYVLRHYRSLRGFVDAYTVVVTFIAAFAVCGYSYLCPGADVALAASASSAAGVAIGLRRTSTRPVSYTVAGLLVGVLLAMFIPYSWTPYVLLAFAAYDAFAVTRGPLRSIPQDMDLLMVDLGDVRVGLGDVAFYTFAASSLELFRGPVWALAGVLAIAAGTAATLLLLRRVDRPLPGLTIPLVICVILFLI
mgnify:FL=1